LDLIEYLASKFDLKMGENYWYRLSLGNRDDEKKYFKDDKAWDTAENVLRKVLKQRNCTFVEAEDEAAFYGPKIDVQMKNVNGKEDTAFTVQYDFVMSKRFNLVYTNAKGEEQEVMVVHRSSIGALERAIAFLIEHHAGAFPVWLAPVQVILLPVSEKHVKYVNDLSAKLKEVNVRVEVDDSNETIGYKIRNAEKQKVPYMLVVGDKEIESGHLSVRKQGSSDTTDVSFEEFVKIVTVSPEINE